MIVMKEKLEMRNSNQFFYDDKLFSGISLVVDSGIIKEKSLYEEGTVVGDFIPPFSLYETSIIEVDSNFLQGDEEPFYLLGTYFNGVSYSIVDGELVSVKQYENGEEVSVANYNGVNLASLEHAEMDDNFTQDYVWSEDGDISHYSIYSRDDFQFSLHLPSKNTISLLIVRGDYFSNIDMKKEIVLFQGFETPSFLESMKGSENLSVSGSGVDDDLFNELVKNNGLDEVRKLQIYDSSLTKASIDKLIMLGNISELHVESTILKNEDLIGFQLKNPNSYVMFNGNKLVG